MAEEILSASEKQISEWSQEIIKKNNLAKNSYTEDITDSIIAFFKGKLPDYDIEVYEIEEPAITFNVRKIIQKEETESDKLDIFGSFFNSSTEEERNMESKLLEAFKLIIKELNILHPINYSEITKKIGLQTYDKPPKYSDENFIQWATKCIDYFKFARDTPTLDLIINSIQFFDILMTTYSVYYTKYKIPDMFPIYVEKIGDDSLFYSSESLIIQKSYFATYIHILEILERKQDYPKDSEFFYNLAHVYEELGMKSRAEYFGKIALGLEHHNTDALFELVMYYIEHKRVQDGVEYMKRLGGVYQVQNQKKLAIQMWQGVSRFDQGADVVSALITLYNDLGMKNELNQILSYVKMNSDKYKDIMSLIDKFEQ